jgi:hypothetical protein
METGDRLGRYTLGRLLGRSAESESWLADDPALSREVVLKVLGPVSDASARMRLEREAQVLARVEVPNVRRLLEYGVADFRPYLVFEYVDGTSLDRVLETRGVLSVSDALAMGRCVAAALGAVHELGVLHRDIKPSNIVIPRERGQLAFERAVLMDFGLFGKVIASSEKTLPGEFYGTPRYMSPEQLQAAEQSAASDVYGLGLVIYESLYGTVPFSGSLADLFRRATDEPVYFPSSSTVPYQLVELLRSMLSRDPAVRPGSGAVVARLLANVHMPVLEPTTSPGPPPSPMEWRAPERDYERPVNSSGPSLHVGSRYRVFVLGLCVLALTAGVVTAAVLTEWHAPRLDEPGLELGLPLIGVFGGLALVGAGIGTATWGRSWIRAKRPQIAVQAADMLVGRDELTTSIAPEVDQLIRRVEQLDARILAKSLALMVHEYKDARDATDREGAQRALINLTIIVEKLTSRLTPWYVRHEKVVTIGGSAVGVISGATSFALNVVKLGENL